MMYFSIMVPYSFIYVSLPAESWSVCCWSFHVGILVLLFFLIIWNTQHQQALWILIHVVHDREWFIQVHSGDDWGMVRLWHCFNHKKCPLIHLGPNRTPNAHVSAKSEVFSWQMCFGWRCTSIPTETEDAKKHCRRVLSETNEFVYILIVWLSFCYIVW